MATTPLENSKKNRFWLWLLWALGIRTPAADAEYGETLASYRRWSSIPVMVMSIAVFFLIVVKIVILITTFIQAFGALNPEVVVNQYDLSTPVEEIVLSSMIGIATQLFHAIPPQLTIPLAVLWFLAFVVDFAVAAILAEDKKLWWRRHWGGVITALITIP